MSVTPTARACRLGTLAALAVLAAPTAALADGDHGKAKGKDKSAPAACDDAKQSKHPHGGPPGLTKKADAMPECRDADEAPAANQSQQQAGAPVVVNVTVAAPVAAAPVSAQVNSSSGRCEARRTFRVTLYKGKARRARVVLNGRAISVTRTRKSTSVLLDMRGRKNQSFTLRHTVVTKTGRLKTGTRRFRTCG